MRLFIYSVFLNVTLTASAASAYTANDVAGEWFFTIACSERDTHGRARLAPRQGNELTGSFATEQGTSGEVTGTIAGDEASMVLSYVVDGRQVADSVAVRFIDQASRFEGEYVSPIANSTCPIVGER